MLAGHYASAFAGKAVAERVPLWALFLASQFVDVIHMAMVLLGIERTTLDQSLPTNPLVIEYVPYTHSLLGSLGWALLVYFIAWRWLASSRAALVLALVTLSHWWLDLLMHRPDLTLHGGEPRLGLGLWNHPVLAHTVELAVLGLAVVVWLRRTRPKLSRAIVLVAFLVGVQVYSIVAPAPTDIREIAVSALVFFGLASGLAAWAQRD